MLHNLTRLAFARFPFVPEDQVAGRVPRTFGDQHFTNTYTFRKLISQQPERPPSLQNPTQDMNGLTPTGVLLPKAVQGSDGSLPSPSQLQQRDMLFGKVRMRGPCPSHWFDRFCLSVFLLGAATLQKRVAEDCYLGNTPKASCLSPPGSGPDFVKPAKSFLFEFYQLRDLRPDFQVWSVPSFRCRLVCPEVFPLPLYTAHSIPTYS